MRSLLATLALLALCVSTAWAMDVVVQPKKKLVDVGRTTSRTPLLDPAAADSSSPSSFSSPSSSFVTMCRSNPNKREHHKFIRLNTDCFKILFEGGMNPFTGELLGEAKQKYMNTGCPYFGASKSHALWRRFLFMMFEVGPCYGDPDVCLDRFRSSFDAAGLPPAEQERFERVKAMMMQRIGVGAWRFMADYDKRCNPESICHVSDYCARTIIASMSTDLLESDYQMYGATLIYNKKVTHKKQRSHVETIKKVHQGLLDAEETEPCDLGDIVAQREADTAHKKNTGVHNCWTLIKKFKKTAKLLCQQKRFWQENQCGPNDCDHLCDDNAAKTMAADEKPGFPYFDNDKCLALSLLHLCRDLKAPATEDWLEDSCLPLKLAQSITISPKIGSLADFLATPLTTDKATAVAKPFCSYLHKDKPVLDEVVAAMVAYSNREKGKTSSGLSLSKLLPRALVRAAADSGDKSDDRSGGRASADGGGLKRARALPRAIGAATSSGSSSSLAYQRLDDSSDPQ